MMIFIDEYVTEIIECRFRRQCRAFGCGAFFCAASKVDESDPLQHKTPLC
jgi:hypothetical protein